MDEKGGALVRSEDLTEENDEKRHDSRLMAVILIGLVVVALGLGCGIYFVRHGNDNVGEIEKIVYDSVSALEVNERIMSKFDEESDYGLQEAANDFEAEMDSGDNERRLYVAIYYADFIYAQTHDLEQSVEILKRVEELLDSNELLSAYYAELQQLYLYDGNNEQAECYAKKVIELLPQDVNVEEDSEQ